MKTNSIGQYIMKQQRLLYTAVISVIFFLTAAVLLLSTYYRVDSVVSDGQDSLNRYMQQFFDTYRQRTEEYNQNQTIRNLLRYTADAPEDVSYQADSGFILPSDVSLYVDSRQVYPAGVTADLPASLLETIKEETLVYTDALYYLVPYYNFTHTKQLGLLGYEIFGKSLLDYCSSTFPPQLAFTLYDSSGNPFYQSENVSPLLSKRPFVSQSGLFSAAVYVDLDGYYHPTAAFLVMLFAVCLAGILISSYLFRRLAQRIVFPINQLALSLRRNQSGELTYIPITPSNLKEIDQISSAYQEMLDRIRGLVEQNHRQNLLKAESELKMLQEKINPHFLFNTLELISSQAILEDADKTALLAQKLGSLFRYSLRMPDILYLKQEIQYARDYLFLQNVRYNGHILYEIQSAPDLDQFLLPKLTLQPILENCFKHGFSSETDRDHHIRVRVCQDTEIVLIQIRDDGCGIHSTQADRLNRDMELDIHDFSHFVHRGEHIGLRNVNARLCSYYGISAATTISPSETAGTLVTVRLPCGPANNHQKGDFPNVQGLNRG